MCLTLQTTLACAQEESVSPGTSSVFSGHNLHILGNYDNYAEQEAAAEIIIQLNISSG